MNPKNNVPLELMKTFVKIAEYEGDATAAAKELGISQPSISRRISALRERVGGDEGQPWLILKGKRWLLTPSGERVQHVVADLVRRYEKVQHFIDSTHDCPPTLAIAAGQTAATGNVRLAIEQFTSANPDVRIRLSTFRGKSRIEGVAGGQLDLAIVTDDEATIRDVAGIDLHIEPLCSDRFVVAANPKAKTASKSVWAKAWNALPVRRPLTAKDLVGLPMILPEPDAGRRQQFDNWFRRSTDITPNVVLEVGGWQNLLRFVQSGLGVGFATVSAVDSLQQAMSRQQSSKSVLQTKFLDEQDFPPDEIRLIARKRQGHDKPDPGPSASVFYELLKEQYATGRNK